MSNPLFPDDQGEKANDLTTLKIFISLSFLVLCTTSLFAQKKNASYQLPIKKASSAISIDGSIEDAAWQEAAVAKDFFMILPMDTSKARVRTEVRMTYDDHALYLIAVCYNALPGPYIVESLRRDFSFGKNDNFLLFMDPFDDQTNGFSFGANAAGAQWDGLMYDGGKVNLSWDNKWTSVVQNYDDRWVFEAAIPFKTIRYKKGITRWGINFSRLDLKTTEKSSWAPVPRQFPSASLAYTGILAWDAPPPTVNSNVSVIPYALGGMSKDYAGDLPQDYRMDVGVDAKVAITSSLNLDLTINPDFSQVDVDQQVTNLDRFELFFPERRQFFLENGDLFANFGYETIRPFFSRRIGLGAPIQFGARLSGKLNQKWRMGAMDIQTGRQQEIGLPTQNFAVMSLQRQVFARSNINLMVINKQSVNYQPETTTDLPVYSQYNRNIGLEYNLASSNNLWTGKMLMLKSFSPGNPDDEFAHAANLQYASKKWLINWRQEYVGANYNAEVGYVPRKSYYKFSPQVGYLFLPNGGKILSHGPQFETSLFFNKDWQQTDQQTKLTYQFTFRNLSTLSSWVANNYVRLIQPFDPTNTGSEVLETGTEHQWQSWGTTYVSKPNSLFTWTFTSLYGGYYASGKRLNMTAELGYRFQPYVSITANASYNNILLPEPWNRKSFWLIGPRMDVTMTNKLFITAFLQYNEQIKNVNLNTRLQWRYQPASDLFIVYTDNYLPSPFGVKNRALVIKLTYWWNV